AMAGWRASRGRGRGSEARGSRAFPFDLNRCHTAKPRATSTRWLFSLAHVRLEGTSVRALCPPLVLLWAYVDVPAGPMPSPLSRSPPGKIEVPVRTDSYSVTATTPGTGSSMALMIVVLTGTSATCLLSAVSSGRFFLTAGFFALMPARWILDLLFSVSRALQPSCAQAWWCLPCRVLSSSCAPQRVSLLLWPWLSPVRRAAGTVISTQVSYAALSPNDSPLGVEMSVFTVDIVGKAENISRSEP